MKGTFMSALLQLGLANALAALVLGSAATIAARFCRQPAVVHSLWLLVLLKLVTPPALPLPVAESPFHVTADPVTPHAEMSETAVAAAPADTSRAKTPIVPIGELIVEIADPDNPSEKMQALILAPMPDDAAPVVEPKLPRPELAVKPPPTARRAAVTPAFVSGIGAIWIGGTILSLLWIALGIVRFQRLLRFATLAPPAIQQETQRRAAAMGLSVCPRVWLLPGPIPPMVWTGLGRARLLFPSALVTRLNPEERAALIAHELAHVRRRDHWVRWLELLVLALYWWFPLAWWARRQLQMHEEECCDAWVVADLPPRTYAAAIMETIDFLAEKPRCLPALASGLGRLYYLKRRLTMIFDRRTPKRLSAIGRGAVLTSAVVLLPWHPTLAQPQSPVLSMVAPLSSPPAPVDEGPPVLLRSRLAMTQAEQCPAAIVAATLSADGTLVAMALADHSVEIRDAQTLELRLALHGHAEAATCLTFAPDGAMLATGSPDKTVILWDVDTGDALHTLHGHSSWVYALAFAPDGRSLASAGYDRTIRIWDRDSGKHLHTLTGHTAAIRALTYAPDGRILASGGSDCTVRLWDLARMAEADTLRGPQSAIRALAFAPGGGTLACGSDDGKIYLWDATTLSLLRTMRSKSGGVATVAFASGGRILASGGTDRQIRLWNVDDGRLQFTTQAHRDGIAAVLAATDGDTIFSAGLDHAIRRWNVEQRKYTVVSRTTVERLSTPPFVPLMVNPETQGKFFAPAPNGMRLRVMQRRP